MIADTVNFHFTDKCNMNCSFCFSHYSKRDNLTSESIKEIIRLLPGSFKRINFVGGEPCIDPNLEDYLMLAKEEGLDTSIVSNGTITLLPINKRERIYEYLDILGISIDSVNKETLLKSGRCIGKEIIPKDLLYRTYSEAKDKNIYTKINTVVTALNYQDIIAPFISTLKPDRWKIFQMLPIEGAHDRREALEVTKSQFDLFLENNTTDITPVIERNSDMEGSYVMISPAGRFYDNTGLEHHYSDPILDVGLENAFRQIHFDKKMFMKRKGSYDYSQREAVQYEK